MSTTYRMNHSPGNDIDAALLLGIKEYEQYYGILTDGTRKQTGGTVFDGKRESTIRNKAKAWAKSLGFCGVRLEWHANGSHYYGKAKRIEEFPNIA